MKPLTHHDISKLMTEHGIPMSYTTVRNLYYRAMRKIVRKLYTNYREEGTQQQQQHESFNKAIERLASNQDVTDCVLFFLHHIYDQQDEEGT